MRERILFLSKKYNKSKRRSFAGKTADKRYLGPIGFSLNHPPPIGFENNKNRLTAQDEVLLFQALHFLKFLMDKSGKTERGLSSKKMARIFALHNSARNRIVSGNLGLVYGCITKTSIQLDYHAYLSAGYAGLIDAADGFDPWRKFKFSTYASTAIFRRFRRELKLNTLIPTSEDTDPDNLSPPDKEIDKNVQLQIDRVLKFIQDQTHDLTELEIRILKSRWGLNESKTFHTLQFVAEQEGYSKERIRQLQNDAFYKLRMALQDCQLLR